MAEYMAERNRMRGMVANENSLVTNRPTRAAATAPTAAASVGLAKPPRIEPTMTMGISSVGLAPRAVRARWRKVRYSLRG